MIYEMQAFDHFTILMLPIIAHFAILIGFSVWGFIDDSHNKYAKWVFEKLDDEESTEKWGAIDTTKFSFASAVMTFFYFVGVLILLKIHPLAPYALAGFAAMMLIGRSLRRLQKIVTDHVNDKKIHKGGK